MCFFSISNLVLSNFNFTHSISLFTILFTASDLHLTFPNAIFVFRRFKLLQFLLAIGVDSDKTSPGNLIQEAEDEAPTNDGESRVSLSLFIC